MLEFSDDIYYLYGIGLHKLLELIGKKNKHYFDALVFQQRLVENISQTRLYGDTDTRKSERAEIISNLNKLSLRALNVSFNELCQFASIAETSIKQQVGLVNQSTTIALPSGAWIHLQEVEKTYKNQVKTIERLTNIKEYEQASNLYWKTLYYSGYRELWKDREILSKQILNLSLQSKDYKASGLILSKGIAYAFMAQKRYADAEFILNKALLCFRKTGSYQEEGVYYDYMADIYEETGQLDKAIEYYKEAMQRYKNMEQYQVYLKLLFLNAKHDDVKSSSRVVALTLLRDQFGLIKNYREGLAEMEIAKSLYTLQDTDEALYRAQQAYNLLNNVIIMPRNAKKAKDVLQIITEKKPLPSE